MTRPCIKRDRAANPVEQAYRHCRRAGADADAHGL